MTWLKKIISTNDVRKAAKKQLDENREVFESLRAYDEGKKEISTTDVERHLRDLQPTT